MKIKFGVYLRQPDWTLDQIKNYVHKVEDLGYYGIYTNDHLIGFDKKRNFKEPYLDAWTFMTMILGWTSRIHAGHTVLCQSFRSPMLLAKMVSSLDFLSKGRFDLILGAGWNEEEYNAYGIPFPSVKIRYRQLEEYVEILKTMFNPKIEEWDFKGEFWQLKQNRNFPKPSSHISIHIGGTKPKITKLAAKIGDGFNTIGSIDDSIRIYQIHDEEVKKLGIKPESRIKSYFNSIRIFKEEKEVINFAKDIISKNPNLENKKPEEVIANNLWGTPESLARTLRNFIEKTDVNFFQLAFRSDYGDPLEIFWDEIRPSI